ncbi:hypothetical protein [Caballeronia sp. GAWG2-1]|uniref:hypothetical protein n=1 Tax=Caballeronia sp. GAWG2-1 TaxID=2921744 RepID=UPI0020285137|nr:hypothetical protein [Caballeronia sp. GAWG2-1]
MLVTAAYVAWKLSEMLLTLRPMAVRDPFCLDQLPLDVRTSRESPAIFERVFVQANAGMQKIRVTVDADFE